MSTLYAVRTIIGEFKKKTGKDFYEWRTMLLEKQYVNRDAAREYIIQNGLDPWYADFLL